MDAIFADKTVWKKKKLSLDKKEVPILRMWHPSAQGDGISIKGYLNHFIKVWDEEKVEVENHVRNSKQKDA